MIRRKRTIDTYLKATIKEVRTVNLHGCGIERYYDIYLGKYIQGSGTLENGSFYDLKPLKNELNASRSKRNYIAMLERRDNREKKIQTS